RGCRLHRHHDPRILTVPAGAQRPASPSAAPAGPYHRPHILHESEEPCLLSPDGPASTSRPSGAGSTIPWACPTSTASTTCSSSTSPTAPNGSRTATGATPSAPTWCTGPNERSPSLLVRETTASGPVPSS